MTLSLLLLSVFAGLSAPEPTSVGDEDLAQLLERERAAHAETRRELEALRLRFADVQRALTQCEEERLEREREWLGYTKAIAGLSRPNIPETVSFESVLEGEESAQQEERAEEIAALEARGHEVFLAMRSLFVAEGIEGYDILRTGYVRDGATGPVVLRVLDGMRRPVGSLTAERLRLEGSESGHTLTLVFEQGYERRGGIKIPFEGGTLGNLSNSVRRIVLPNVDPKPWMEAMPELFERKKVELPVDDGRWNGTEVRRRLNELLHEDTTHGNFHLHSLSGVVDNRLREVHLEERDREDRVLRRLFADFMELQVLESGIRITLESGAQVRGEEKLPFLGGRYQIFLPDARLEGWCDGRLPGLPKPKKPVEVPAPK